MTLEKNFAKYLCVVFLAFEMTKEKHGIFSNLQTGNVLFWIMHPTTWLGALSKRE